MDCFPGCCLAGERGATKGPSLPADQPASQLLLLPLSRPAPAAAAAADVVVVLPGVCMYVCVCVCMCVCVCACVNNIKREAVDKF